MVRIARPALGRQCHRPDAAWTDLATTKSSRHWTCAVRIGRQRAIFDRHFHCLELATRYQTLASQTKQGSRCCWADRPGLLNQAESTWLGSGLTLAIPGRGALCARVHGQALTSRWMTRHDPGPGTR